MSALPFPWRTHAEDGVPAVGGPASGCVCDLLRSKT